MKKKMAQNKKKEYHRRERKRGETRVRAGLLFSFFLSLSAFALVCDSSSSGEQQSSGSDRKSAPDSPRAFFSPLSLSPFFFCFLLIPFCTCKPSLFLSTIPRHFPHTWFSLAIHPIFIPPPPFSLLLLVPFLLIVSY